jgi:hypothetical protein
MNAERISQAHEPRDVYLDRTRRQFQFAREQLAAHSLERYFAIRGVRGGAAGCK